MMFQFSAMVRALPLILLACSVHAQHREHSGSQHSPKDQRGHAPMERQRGDERNDGAMPPQGNSGWAPSRGSYFTPDHHERAREYFDMPEHRGFVPPGLVRKGGLPPGASQKVANRAATAPGAGVL